MIALTILYTAVVGVLCGAAAACAERGALAVRGPARWGWMVAIVASSLLPGLVVWRVPAPNGGAAPLGTLVELLVAFGAATPAAGPAGRSLAHVAAQAGGPHAWATLDRPAALAWASTAAVVLLRLASRVRRTRCAIMVARRGRGARTYAVAGARVLVTPALGPAVLGPWRVTVAVPRWVRDDGDADRRRLVFAHEAEHVRAGDAPLLTAATVCVALVPWSPAAWWMLRRLRTAVELDCDRRVLTRAARGASASVAAYGRLLLDVAARHAAAPFGPAHLAPALATSTRTTLERRIHQMTAPRPTLARTRLVALACGAGACVAIACELPHPTGLRMLTARPFSSVVPGATSSPDSTPGISVADVRAVLGAERLNAMRRVTGRTQVVYVIDRVGTPRSVVVRVVSAGPAEASLSFSNAAIVVRRFPPGEIAADTTTVAWVRVGAVPGTASPGDGSLTAPRISTRGDGPLQPGLDSILVVIDGRIVGRGHAAIDSVTRASIASVDVLKGKVATDRFGSAARAGAIVVTRKPPAR